MSKPFLQIRWRGKKGYGSISKDKMLGKAFDSALRGMVFHWKHNFMPLHFRNLARSRYKYAAREGERGHPRWPTYGDKSTGRTTNIPRKYRETYTGRKLTNEGHTRPLIGKRRTIFGAAKSANTVTTAILPPDKLVASLTVMSRLLNLSGPAGYVKHKGSSPHSSYLSELSAINPGEVRPLESAFKKAFTRKWVRLTKTTTSFKVIK